MDKEKILKQETGHLDDIINDMSLMDDDLFALVFDHNKAATELLLKIILKREDIKIIDVVAQRELRNPNVDGRKIRLDVLAADSLGKHYNIEVQEKSSGANEKRARFHSSMIDVRMLKSREEFKILNESYVIFITEKDYFKKKMPIYTINRHIEETNETFHDGSHILYVNGSYKGTDKLGELIHDFHCKNSEDILNKELADGVSFFKNGGYQQLKQTYKIL